MPVLRSLCMAFACLAAGAVGAACFQYLDEVQMGPAYGEVELDGVSLHRFVLHDASIGVDIASGRRLLVGAPHAFGLQPAEGLFLLSARNPLPS